MTDKINFEMISRRTLLGLAAALGCAGPATMLTVSEAEAQTAGMDRREERRDRRSERRDARRQRREARRRLRRPTVTTPAPAPAPK